MSEYIGCRISLISKSDIKYIGTLHEINSENSTVALENVKSWGTEGRKGNPAEEIPPNDQIYEYIVFRGNDVKDLTIVQRPNEPAPPQAQMPNDPAILGSARPPSQQPSQQQQQPQQPPQMPQGQQWPPQQMQPQYPPYGYPPQPAPRFAGPGGPHGFPGMPGAPPGYGIPPYQPPPGANGWYPPNNQFPQDRPSPGHEQGNFMQGPQLGQDNTSPIDMSNVQEQSRDTHAPIMPANRPGGGRQPAGQQVPQQPRQQALPDQNQKPSELSATPTQIDGPQSRPLEHRPKPNVERQSQEQRPQARQNEASSRVAVPMVQRNTNAPDAKTSFASIASIASKPQSSTPAAPSTADSARSAKAAVEAAMAKLGGHSTTTQQEIPRSTTNNRAQAHEGRRGQPRERGAHGSQRGNTRRHVQPQASQTVEIPKDDFDFESNNAKFKSIEETDAAATNAPTGAAAAAAIAAGDHPSNDITKPASGAASTYDKKSSFFDDISSELKDRKSAQDEGKSFGGRDFRNGQRILNVETFGQGSVDTGRGRGGARGGRGRGRGYREGGFGGRGRGVRAGGDAAQALA